MSRANQESRLVISPPDALQPELDDQIEQYLAELSLSNVPDQFPSWIYRSKYEPGRFSKRMQARYGDAITASNIPIIDNIKDRLSNLTEEHESVELAPINFAPFLKFPNRLPSTDFPSFDINVDIDIFSFRILRVVSANTTQGVVYEIAIRPQAQPPVHYTDALAKEVQPVIAVMKKSPIYNVATWARFNALEMLLDPSLAQGDTAQDKIRNIKHAFSLAGVPKETISKLTDMAYTEQLFQETNQQLKSQYSTLNNDAYIDSVGYFLTSQLVESLISPGFGLLYGSTRVFDLSYFKDQDTRYVFADLINESFPVQLTILQKLSSSLEDVFFKTDYFLDPTRNHNHVDNASVKSTFAQIITALSASQETIGMVHNDLHMGNILHEEVDPKRTPYIYYQRKPSAKFPTRVPDQEQAGRPTYYRVPTLGKVFKIIDFGRASFSFTSANGEKINIESGTPDRVWGGIGLHDVKNYNTDLFRFTDTFVSLLAKKHFQPDAALNNIIGSILTCDKEGTTFDWRKACHASSAPLGLVPAELVDITRRPLPPRYRNNDAFICDTYYTNVYPYTKQAACVNAIPANNTLWMDAEFGIAKADIPDGEIIYTFFG